MTLLKLHCMSICYALLCNGSIVFADAGIPLENALDDASYYPYQLNLNQLPFTAPDIFTQEQAEQDQALLNSVQQGNTPENVQVVTGGVQYPNQAQPHPINIIETN